MKSRYDRNQELYKKVKENDFEDYNNQIEDFDLEFEAKDSRKSFHEKKRLSLYFKDIEQELETANTKLNSMSEESALEIKKDIDLKSLIEQAKKNHREQGGNIFSNTQYEILSSLNVEENVDAIDEEERDLILEDIIGETKELQIEKEVVVENDLGNSIVNLQVLDSSFYDVNDTEKLNFAVTEDTTLETSSDEEDFNVEENTDEETKNHLEEAELEVSKEYETPINDEVSDTTISNESSEDAERFIEELEETREIEIQEDEVKEETREIEIQEDEAKEVEVEKENTKEEVKIEKDENLNKQLTADVDSKEVEIFKTNKASAPKNSENQAAKNDKLLTVLLVFLIVSLVVVILVIASQYLGGM